MARCEALLRKPRAGERYGALERGVTGSLESPQWQCHWRNDRLLGLS